MTTPIVDFVKAYCESASLRLHMPGHKGKKLLGGEEYDITEIDGADSLFGASGIIAESEKNASEIFGVPTFYSTEGSSHCIKAMLWLLSKRLSRPPFILAGRNAHKAFISAAALTGAEIEWLWGDSLLRCEVNEKELEDRFLRGNVPDALYITTPDYSGYMPDVAKISRVCKKYGVLLLADCAHGAYLRFVGLHPSQLSADMCCTSAHKTLPVLTGGAYLHVSEDFKENAKEALELFGSTSPSYLILRSLDNANKLIAEGYGQKVRELCERLSEMKKRLSRKGYVFLGNEPMKLSVDTLAYGYTGKEFASALKASGIVAEFYAKELTVLMPTPMLTQKELDSLEAALSSIPRKAPLESRTPTLPRPEKVLSPKEALLLPTQTLPTEECEGRILCHAVLSCPPAVPIAVLGERLNAETVRAMLYWGITECKVAKEGYSIRKAAVSDLPEAERLYAEAREYMRENGNPTQWQGGYPQRDIILADIFAGRCFLCTEYGKAVGVFCFFKGDDPTYKVIYDGKWLQNGEYGVIHRIAAASHRKGVASFCFRHCLSQVKSLRIDTHRDNIPMQRSLAKNGFTYCGIIHLENGDERLAYEKISL